MNTSRMIIALTMALYLVMTIGVGVAFSRRGASSTSEFYLGGRKLGPLVTAMSAEASDMSSYLLMGLPDDVQPEVKISEHLTSFRGNLMEKIERYPGYFTIDSVV